MWWKVIISILKMRKKWRFVVGSEPSKIPQWEIITASNENQVCLTLHYLKMLSFHSFSILLQYIVNSKSVEYIQY